MNSSASEFSGMFVEAAPQGDGEVRLGPKVGTALHTLLQDLAVVVSLALQNGVPV